MTVSLLAMGPRANGVVQGQYTEAQAAAGKLNSLLGLIEQMQAVDTTGIEPMSHAMDLVQRLREDKAVEPDRREAFQAIAPAVEDGLYLVPRVVE